MNPATPVTTQILGAETSSSRSRRYRGEITSSQWKSTRRAESEQRAREHAISIIHAALAASQRRDKASSIPTEPIVVRHISRVSTGVYEFGRNFAARDHSLLCRGVAPSCGGRTTIDLFVSIDGRLPRNSSPAGMVLTEEALIADELSKVFHRCYRPVIRLTYIPPALDHSELRVGHFNCQHLGVAPVFAPTKADHSISNKILVTLVSR
jgi:hypothetical protein